MPDDRTKDDLMSDDHASDDRVSDNKDTNGGGSFSPGPVAGALGLALLGAAVLRFWRRRRDS